MSVLLCILIAMGGGALVASQLDSDSLVKLLWLMLAIFDIATIVVIILMRT